MVQNGTFLNAKALIIAKKKFFCPVCESGYPVHENGQQNNPSTKYTSAKII